MTLHRSTAGRIRWVFRASLFLGLSLLLQMGASTVQGIEERAYVRDTVIWPSRLIPVCSENLGTLNRHARNVTRAALVDSWERHSGVRFVGWGDCTEDSAGIRIRWATSSSIPPHVVELGRDLDGVRNGMVLFRGPVCGWPQDRCVAAVAVHEFGHALGFAHEQNRPDTPASCIDAPQGGNGNVLISSWDPVSVMNYCNATWNNGAQLSAGDKLAVQTYYGPPVAACADGADNDSDGRIDFPDDPGCEAEADLSERQQTEVDVVLVQGKKLKILESPGRHRIRFRAVDAAIVPPPLDGPRSPARWGARLVFANPQTGDVGRVELDRRDWKPKKRGAFHYKGRNCTVSLKRGRVQARCKHFFPLLRLDEPSQGEVTVRLEIGARDALCASFGGEIRVDEGTTAHPKGRGRFLAKDAPPPVACDI